MQLAMLSAVMKLFFKRPPECQQLLGATLAAAAAEPSQDVHDRALLYYRSYSELLRHVTASRTMHAYPWSILLCFLMHRSITPGCRCQAAYATCSMFG